MKSAASVWMKTRQSASEASRPSPTSRTTRSSRNISTSSARRSTWSAVPQIRNAGTIGGNTCNGVTSADSASTLHAWEAIVELTGKNGKRYLPIKDFYIKAGTVDINVADGEIQTAIIIPKESYDRTAGFYIKYAMRNAMDIATTGCSVNCRLSEDKKTFERVRIAYGVAGPVPMRVPSAESFINGKAVTLENIETFSRTVLEDIHPQRFLAREQGLPAAHRGRDGEALPGRIGQTLQEVTCNGKQYKLVTLHTSTAKSASRW